ncbi:DUF2332 domain-containing protein [Nocardia sp. NPDC057668]|uniref:DUF2332 domain-containing protein n=1 Tax=Nocardia sp. NPDC057668 TaxID=3346202 RepID=UPI00366B561A
MGAGVRDSERYSRFAELEVRGYSDCYAEWASGVAGDPGTLELIGGLPVAKRQPQLVFGAVRYLGLGVVSYGEFREFLVENRDEVREIVMTHRTQTNEAGRTAALLPVIGQFAGEPVALIEYGASSGLCLYPDRYSYRYDDGPMLDPVDGPSEVVLSCSTSGRPPIPDVLPEVVYRAGLDINPLNVADAEDMRWLEMLIWPEQRDRLERLRGAVEIARRDPPELRAGDLVDSIAELVDAAPRGVPVLVFGSAVLTYLEPERRAVFRELMRSLRCHWITNEGIGVLGFGAAALPPARAGANMVLALDDRAVGYAAPHGQWVDWFGGGGGGL